MIKNNPGHRILELDVLRGLAAVSVLLFHYTTFYAIMYPQQGTPLFNFPWVPLRTQLFAMISGFVIIMIIEKNKSPLDFLVARFSRIFPCYAAAVVLASILIIMFKSLLIRVQPLDHAMVISWPRFLIHFTMLQSWFGYLDIDNVYWYLAVEVSFYFIIFLFLVFKKTQHIEKMGFGVLILVVINARYGGTPAVMIFSRMLCFWQYFFAGILFYNIKTKGDTWWRHAGLAMCFIVQNVISDDIYSVFCLASDFLIFYFFIYGKLSWIVQRPLVFLGTISYSLYLIHLKLGYVIIKLLYMAGANAWFRLIIPTLASIFIATIMTYFIEKPARKFVQAKYTQWQQMKRRIGHGKFQ